MRRNAFGAKTPALAPKAAARRLVPDDTKPIVSAAAPAEAVALRNSRRVGRRAAKGPAAKGLVMSSRLERLCSRMNRGTDAGIGCAAADVAAHGAVDVGIGRRGVLLEKCR